MCTERCRPASKITPVYRWDDNTHAHTNAHHQNQGGCSRAISPGFGSPLRDNLQVPLIDTVFCAPDCCVDRREQHQSCALLPFASSYISGFVLDDFRCSHPLPTGRPHSRVRSCPILSPERDTISWAFTAVRPNTKS